MEKEFIKYEQALALKELGFDEPCIAFYDKLKFSNNISLRFISQRVNNNILNNVKNTNGTLISAPLYQQVFRWFREKYKLHSHISLGISDEQDSSGLEYDEYIYVIEGLNGLDYDNYGESLFYKTYEEAESACLDKLIEICKNK